MVGSATSRPTAACCRPYATLAANLAGNQLVSSGTRPTTLREMSSPSSLSDLIRRTCTGPSGNCGWWCVRLEGRRIGPLVAEELLLIHASGLVEGRGRLAAIKIGRVIAPRTPLHTTWCCNACGPGFGVGAAAPNASSGGNHGAAQQATRRLLPTIYSARHRPPTMTCYSLPVRSVTVSKAGHPLVTQSRVQPASSSTDLALNCPSPQAGGAPTAAPFRAHLLGWRSRIGTWCIAGITRRVAKAVDQQDRDQRPGDSLPWARAPGKVFQGGEDADCPRYVRRFATGVQAGAVRP